MSSLGCQATHPPSRHDTDLEVKAQGTMPREFHAAATRVSSEIELLISHNENHLWGISHIP